MRSRSYLLVAVLVTTLAASAGAASIDFGGSSSI